MTIDEYFKKENCYSEDIIATADEFCTNNSKFVAEDLFNIIGLPAVGILFFTDPKDDVKAKVAKAGEEDPLFNRKILLGNEIMTRYVGIESLIRKFSQTNKEEEK